MLNNFKWYRKLRGSVWYYVKTEYPRQLNMNNPLYPFWSRFVNQFDKIIKIENYTIKNKNV